MFALVSKVYAACDPNAKPGDGNVDLGCLLKLSNSTSVKDVYDSPAFLVNLLVRNAFVFAGIIIFLMILYAGFRFISNGTKGKEEAKGILTACAVGLAIMFAAYWVVQIMKVITGVDVAL